MVDILIADSQYLTRAGLKAIIANSAHIQVVGEVTISSELIVAVELLQPDLIVIDPFVNAGFTKLDVLQIKSRFPHIPLLLYSLYLPIAELRHLVPTIVKALISKRCDAEEIVEAILHAGRGNQYFCRRTFQVLFESKVIPAHKELPVLSEREVELVHLFASGLTNREVADRLFLSFHTVRTHRRNIMKKVVPTFTDLSTLSAALIQLKN